MPDNMIISSLIDQFDRALHMFRTAVTNCPDDEWLTGDLDYLRPAGVAYHVVESLVFYGGDVAVDSFNWGGRFGCDWEDPDASKLPTRKDVLTYLDETWSSVRTWMMTCDPDQSETLFSWTGTILHSRLLYVLRHIQHHTAEMSLELKRRGYVCPDWK